MPAPPNLRVVVGPVVDFDTAPLDVEAFQERCVEGYLASRVARGFSAITIEGEAGVLERFLGLADKPAWDRRRRRCRRGASR